VTQAPESRKRYLAEFKDFVMQGNVVDLAVAVVIAMFFGAVIKDIVNLILSLVAIPGKSDKAFSSLSFTIGHGLFQYGTLITDLITFIIVAFVVFFVVVRPMRILMERRRRQPEPDSDNRPCPECLSDIPKAAGRCAYCTAVVPKVA
jgi:large conductance mechanosensitive channel